MMQTFFFFHPLFVAFLGVTHCQKFPPVSALESLLYIHKNTITTELGVENFYPLVSHSLFPTPQLLSADRLLWTEWPRQSQKILTRTGRRGEREGLWGGENGKKRLKVFE